MRLAVPIVTCAVALGWLSAAEAAPRRSKPAQRPAVMDVVNTIRTTLTDSRYSHTTRVNTKAGDYQFDCSGMAAWVLRRSAPVALGSVMYKKKNARPLARDFYYRIARTPAGKPRWGWQRVSRVQDARAGDVIAWLRPKMLRSHNTGHVAFVVQPPVPLPETAGAYLLRIADASRYQHENDTRRGTGRTGFGIGTILVLADLETGAPKAYGWVGRHSRWLLPTRMALGRPVR